MSDANTMDDELRQLIKNVTDQVTLEYRDKHLKGEFVKTTVHAYVTLGNTDFGYSSDSSPNYPLLEALAKLKIHMNMLEREGR